MEEYTSLSQNEFAPESHEQSPLSPDSTDVESGIDCAEVPSLKSGKAFPTRIVFFLTLIATTGLGGCASLFVAAHRLLRVGQNQPSTPRSTTTGSFLLLDGVHDHAPKGNSSDSSEQFISSAGFGHLCAWYGCKEGFQKRQYCQCNSRCAQYASCCPDFEDVCGREDEGGSCAAFGCVGGYVPSRPCQCTESCSRFRNCCYDYDRVCGALAPFPPQPLRPPAPAPIVPNPAPAPITPIAPQPIPPGLVITTEAPNHMTTEEPWQPILPEDDGTTTLSPEDEQVAAEIAQANRQVATLGAGMLACLLCSGMCCAIGGLLQEMKTGAARTIAD